MSGLVVVRGGWGGRGHGAHVKQPSTVLYWVVGQLLLTPLLFFLFIIIIIISIIQTP